MGVAILTVLATLVTSCKQSRNFDRKGRDLRGRVSILYDEGFGLDFDMFVKIVCPDGGREDLGEILLGMQFKGAVGIGGEFSITIQKGIKLIAMDDGGTSDPYVIIKVGDEQQKTTVKLKTLNPTCTDAHAHVCTYAHAHACTGVRAYVHAHASTHFHAFTCVHNHTCLCRCPYACLYDVYSPVP